ADVRTAYRVHVQNGAEIAHIVLQIVVSVSRGGAPRGGEADSLHRGATRLQQLVGPRLDPPGHVGVRGSAVGRVVFEAAVAGRIMRGRDDDAVGETRFASAVVGENGMRDRGSGGVFAA